MLDTDLQRPFMISLRYLRYTEDYLTGDETTVAFFRIGVCDDTYGMKGQRKMSINQSINQSLFKHGKIQQELKIKNNLTILNKIQNLTTTNLTKTCFS